MNPLSDADQADYSDIAEDCARAAIVNHEDNGPFRSTRDAARAVADLTTNISSTTALANFQQAGAICIQVIHQL